MAVKKLSIKKNKAGKLSVHKKGSKDAEQQDSAEEALQKDAGGKTQEAGEGALEKESLQEADTGAGKPTKGIKIKHGKPVVGKTEVTQVSDGVEEQLHQEDEQLAEVLESQHMANVGFSLARSINLGNYESLKISVSINVPSEVDEDEIEGNYDFAKGWCEEKMNDLADEYVGED